MVVITPIVFGGIAIALITILNDDTGVSTRLADSHDAQITSAYFVRDVQSAMWITTSSTPICGAGSQVLGVAWQPASGAMALVSYSTGGGTSAGLVRNFCSQGATSTSTISHDLASPASAVVTPTCSSSYPACAPANGLIPAGQVASVQIQITEQSQYTYTLSASPRLFTSTNGIPPATSPPTLLLLGNSTSVVSCSASSHASPLDVNGLAAVNSPTAGSLSFNGHATLSADQVYTQDSSPSGASAPVQPPSTYTATTSQPYSSGPPIPDPFSGLADPSTADLTVYPPTTTSSLPGPGVYQSPVSITTSQTIPGGTYIFEGGLQVAGGGSGGGTTIVTSNGAPVLFFIGVPGAGPPQSAGYSVTGQAMVTLTGMTTGNYAGLVLFQSRSDTNILNVAGQGTNSIYGGAIYAPDAQVNTSGQGNTYSTSIVAQSLACGGNGTTSLGPSVVPSTTSVSSSNSNSLSGQSVSLTATVAGSNGLTPSGYVTFTESPNGSPSVTMCSNVALVNGLASCSTPPLTAAGSEYTMTATYDGNITFQASNGTMLQTVTIASTITGVSASPSALVAGEPVTLTASVTPIPDGGSVNWTITYGASGSLTCSSTTALSGGTATCTITSAVLQAGNSPYAVTASYSGDTSYSSSTGTLSLGVGQAITTTTPINPSTTKALSPVTLSASVVANAPGSGTPSGTVTFTASSGSTTITLCSNVNLISGTASCSASSPPKGNWTLTATYSGDANYTASSGTTSWKTN